MNMYVKLNLIILLVCLGLGKFDLCRIQMCHKHKKTLFRQLGSNFLFIFHHPPCSFMPYQIPSTPPPIFVCPPGYPVLILCLDTVGCARQLVLLPVSNKQLLMKQQLKIQNLAWVEALYFWEYVSGGDLQLLGKLNFLIHLRTRMY